MNGIGFLRRIFHRIKGVLKPFFPNMPATNGQRNAILLIQKLQRTADVELTCEEVFALLDEYVEMALRGEDVAALMPLVRHHLEMCADCREEFEALERILRAAATGFTAERSHR